MALSHFDERSGVISCTVPWGKWWQTVAEVFIEVNVEEGTRAKDVRIDIKPNFICCCVKGVEIFKGKLWATVIVEECTWTLEERKLLSLLLVKTDTNCEIWESLLVGQYAPNPWEISEMRKKLDLERFQIEHPGFDFSTAKLSKCDDKIPIPKKEV